ncbi:lanthionine synthetase LanC family protein [Nonomuraea recticatena]|uniref:lanthionine synthetase LanC family protein n=1 Tax=Nonomuraea recticatena TaxID=46178 RepID=UPI0036174385
MTPTETAAPPHGEQDTGTRAKAAAVVADLADRLADPRSVAERAAAPDNTRPLSDGTRLPVWHPVSITDGYPALALLYAELAHTDAAYRKVAHGHLRQAAAEAAQTQTAGLYVGPFALAFAASRAVRRPGEYASVLTRLDERAATWVPDWLRPERERIEAGRAGTDFMTYDVVTGVTGVGRHLLDRDGEHARSALAEILAYLVALTRPLAGAHAALPGWWVRHAPDGQMVDGYEGHGNLGLAHGIAGPLALLALAWHAGVRVPGQDEAMASIADWLLDWHRADEGGAYWPPGWNARSSTPAPPSCRAAAPAGATACRAQRGPCNWPAWRWTGRTGVTSP